MDFDDDDQEQEILRHLDDIDKSVILGGHDQSVPVDFQNTADDILREAYGGDGLKNLDPMILIFIATVLFEVFKWFMQHRRAQWVLHRAVNSPRGVIASMFRERVAGWLPEETRETTVPDNFIHELRKKVMDAKPSRGDQR